MLGMAATRVTQGQPTRGYRVAALQTLAVPGASNSTPSVTALGRTIAAIWRRPRRHSREVEMVTARARENCNELE